MAEDSKLSFCRIAWKIAGHGEGAGEWHDITEKPILESWVDDCNQRYGAGSHRIEYNDGQESNEVVQAAIKDAMKPQALS